KPSVKYRRLVNYNEPLLSNYTEVYHLLEPGKLKDPGLDSESTSKTEFSKTGSG
ncbi:24673_t:CDS:2, partial [Gigaspora margarita]